MVRRFTVLAIAVVVALAGACGGDDDKEAASTSTTVPPATTTTDSEPAVTTTTAPDDESTTTTVAKSTDTTPDPDVDPWERTAQQVEFDENDFARVACPAGGTANSVWGNGLYTNDSSICTAAVHAGLITFADGGRVFVEQRPGAESYAASTANGVTTLSYGSWGGSFILPEAESAG